MDLILLTPGTSELYPLITAPTLPAGLPAAWAGLIDTAHCMQLHSLHQGMNQQVLSDPSNPTRTAGRPVVAEFSCTRTSDRLSVLLYDYCLRAQPLGSGADQPTLLHVLSGIGTPSAQLLTCSLRDALVSEINYESQPDGTLADAFKLCFSEIIWTWRTATEGNVTSGWSVTRNRPIAQFTN